MHTAQRTLGIRIDNLCQAAYAAHLCDLHALPRVS